MPAKTKSKRTARKARPGVHSGKNKKGSRLKGAGRSKQGSSNVIANSLFALTLKKKTGYEIEIRKNNIPGESSLVSKLSKIYKNLTGGKLILNTNEPIHMQVEFVMDKIRSAVPKGSELMLHDEDDGLVLTLYRICEYDNYLPGFVIGDVLPKLKKENVRLYDIFIQFLRSFTLYTGCDAWYNGIFAQSMDRVDEMIQYESDQFDEDDLEKIKTDFAFYDSGPANLISQDIVRKNKLSPEIILRMLARIRKKNEITKVIEDGCKLMCPDAHMTNFRFEPYEIQNLGDYFLPFDCQAMIFFQAPDLITEEYDQWINSEANEGGIAEPVCTLHVRPNNKRVDLKRFQELWCWPKALANYMLTTQSLIRKYTK